MVSLQTELGWNNFMISPNKWNNESKVKIMGESYLCLFIMNCVCFHLCMNIDLIQCLSCQRNHCYNWIKWNCPQHRYVNNYRAPIPKDLLIYWNVQVVNEVKATKTELKDVGQASIQTIYKIDVRNIYITYEWSYVQRLTIADT